MRILCVINDADIGGAQTLLEGIATARKSEADMALIVLMSPGVLSDRLEAAFDEVFYLGLDRSGMRAAIAAHRLRSVIRTYQPDIVHSNLIQSDALAIVTAPRAVPLVTTVHVSRLTSADPFRSHYLYRWVARRARRFAAVVASDESCLSFMAQQRYAADPVVIPNGVQVGPAAPRVPDQSFLTLARWHPVKGYDVLFQAYARMKDEHPDWALVCAGTGLTERNPEVVQQLLDAGLDPSHSQIRLLGSLPDVAPALATAGALVIPSYGETRPLAGMEACAAGVPVIATDVGANRLFVSSTEFLVRPGSPERMADAMAAFASRSAEERAEMGAQVRVHAEERFSIRSTWGAYKQLYADILERKRIPD